MQELIKLIVEVLLWSSTLLCAAYVPYIQSGITRQRFRLGLKQILIRIDSLLVRESTLRYS